MTHEQEAQRGRLARDVLENPVYAESYALIESEITRKWRESKDRDEREDLHRALRMLATARTVLESAMKSGQVSMKELERKQTLAERTIGRLPKFG